MTGPGHEFFQMLAREPIYIAEIGLNHNGDLQLARQMLESAKESGADYAKFQLFEPDAFIAPFAALGENGPGSLRSFFASFALDRHKWKELVQRANDLDLGFACSVFDLPSLALYRELVAKANRPAFVKIASCDINNMQLLKAASSANLPVLLATGTACELEVEAALRLTRADWTMLMQCVSAYPASPASYHLQVLPFWQQKYNCLTGISDHTPGLATSLAALALGARAVERHFTLDKNLPGPDQALSLTPAQFSDLVRQGREISSALGQPVKSRQPEEEGPFLYGRRAAYARSDLAAGSVIEASQIAFLRPGVPGSPADDSQIVGRTLIETISAGSAILAAQLQ